MAEISRDGVTIHYQDEGSGPPVLLIHGHTFDGRTWQPLVPALRAAGLRVIRPDLRGHGRSDRPDSGYHVSHHAADAAAVLEACAAERASVVGHSVGGGVALELAVTRPAAVQTLVLVAPVMPGRPFEPEFMDNLREVAKVTRAEGIASAMRGPWQASPLFAHSFGKPGVREAAVAILEDFPGADYLATARDRIDRGWEVADRLEEITAPTTVVVGEHEMPGFQGYAREAAEGIPGARLEVIADGGHLLPLEEPERLAELIVEAAQPSER